MLNIQGFNRGHILPVALLLVIGISIGWLGFVLLGDFAGNTSIAYVSKKEVLKLEKERIEHLKNEDKEIKDSEKSIFYGHTNEALTLIEQTAKSFEDKTTKVIFVSDEFVQGVGVNSISKTVYERVIEQVSSNKGYLGAKAN